MLMKPLFSIVVPVFNLEEQIEKCIESLRQQTMNDYEIILVDDGSTDRSYEICRRFAAEDTRIQAVSQPNGGVSKARNTGIRLARGKYIVFVDGDDYVERDYLKDLSEADEDADLVIMGYTLEYDTHKIPVPKHVEEMRIRHHESGQIQKLYMNGFLSYVWGKRFSLDMLRERELCFDTELNIGEDICFVMEYILQSFNVIVKDRCSYHYIHYDMRNTLSNRLTADRIAQMDQGLDRICRMLEKAGWPDAENMVIYKYGVLLKYTVDSYIQGNEFSDEKSIRSVMKSRWYGKSLKNNTLYGKESSKYRWLISMKSVFVLKAYRTYLRLKKT